MGNLFSKSNSFTPPKPAAAKPASVASTPPAVVVENPAEVASTSPVDVTEKPEVASASNVLGAEKPAEVASTTSSVVDAEPEATAAASKETAKEEEPAEPEKGHQAGHAGEDFTTEQKVTDSSAVESSPPERPTQATSPSTNQESSEHHVTEHVTAPPLTNQESSEHHVTDHVTLLPDALTELLPGSPEAEAAGSSSEEIIKPTTEPLLRVAMEISGSNTEQVNPMTTGSELLDHDEREKKSETEELAEEVGQPISDEDSEHEQQIVAEVTASGTEAEGPLVTTSENVFGSSQSSDVKPEDVELVVNDSSDGATDDRAHAREAHEESGHNESSPDAENLMQEVAPISDK